MSLDWEMDQTIYGLQVRIEQLERENVELTNSIYELETRLQSQLDALITYTMFAPNDVM